ncbi:hypothetical protein SUGI_0233550 [Cryptomeria japonica]|nr:hypothetical protein SUGI_0233550 [Cryptomeria japonica]
MVVSNESGHSQSVSFGIFKPEEGCNIEDALAYMATVATLIEKTHNITVTILRCLDFSWTAVFAAGKDESLNEDKSTSNLPEAAAFTKGLKCAVRIVDSGWFRFTSPEPGKGVPFAKLSVGDIIIGLGVWDRVESALALEKYPHRNPALPYWKDMGAKKLEYNLCQVVYVTYRSGAQNSRPGMDNLTVVQREAILEVPGLFRVASLSGKGLTPSKQCPCMDPEVEIKGASILEGKSGRDDADE